MLRMGSAMMGPFPCTMSNGMFMPESGVRMSLNRMTPSGLNASHGCSEISTWEQKQAVQYLVNGSNIHTTTAELKYAWWHAQPAYYRQINVFRALPEGLVLSAQLLVHLHAHGSTMNIMRTNDHPMN